MTEVLDLQQDAELVDDQPFFAPAATDMLDGLLGQYQSQRRRVEAVAAYINDPETMGATYYFVEGNRSNDRHMPSAHQLFELKGALAALNAAYWSKALALTDVIDLMPQKRRTEWHETIRNHTAPEFEEQTVRQTIMDLLNMRSQFLAERVDGIFRGLSGEHVTNAPEAFGKRMIVARVLNEYGSEDYQTCGLINDLRCVVAKFMGRDEPHHDASSQVIRRLKGRWGEWVSIDGGAIRIRLYKKGTAHMELHPDMAWRLNMVLAQLYPLAIPAQFRQRPLRKSKTVERIQRPLPFAVLDLLAKMTPAYTFGVATAATRWEKPRLTIPNTLAFGYGDRDKHAIAEAERVLAALGGVKDPDGHFVFDYEPREIRDEIVTSGCIPDQKSHQFYPTPERLARMAVEMADIKDGQTVLEPSAGIGGLADLLPQGLTTCVEVSPLHCKVLEAKGHDACCADFLEWAQRPSLLGSYDRIVMNPPFDRGQWAAHVEHAARLLSPGGRLVAILPSSAKNRDFLPGFNKSWSSQFDGEFAGASVSVVFLTAERTA